MFHHVGAPLAAPLAALLAAAAAAGCDFSPTRPDSRLARTANSAPSGLSRVELHGPGTLAPGESVTFSLTGHFANGSTRDMSGEAVWLTTSADVVSVAPGGLAVARRNGEAMISATVGNILMQSTRNVVVTSPGTYQLKGTIVEAGSGLPLGGSDIEVRASSGEVLRTQAAQSGRFELFDVPPDIALRVSLDGYEPRTATLQLTHHMLLSPLALHLLRPRPDISGHWRLTVGSPGCGDSRGATPLEASLRVRTFTAALAQDGPALSVVLTEARFAPRMGRLANTFSGRLQSTTALLSLLPPTASPDYYYGTVPPQVIEDLGDGTGLFIWGEVALTADPAGMRGAMAGVISRRKLDRLNLVLAECWADHPFELVR